MALTASIVAGTFAMGFWALSPTAPIEDNLKTVLANTNVVFGPIIALLGSVIGFYFGSRAASASGK